MTKLDEKVEEEPRFGRGGYPSDAVARGRWVNPTLGVLGAVVVGGYLMTGYPSTSIAADESTFGSIPDLLKAAFAAVLALTWAMGVAWLGMRRVQVPNILDAPAGFTPAEGFSTHTDHDLLRSPTCERMYDKTRLVPYYLRSLEFPATKQDLVRLAQDHPDEGRALRRLECIPDRHYSSLHDLVSEIRVD
jgi:Protein of unknown function (DUF2795)